MLKYFFAFLAGVGVVGDTVIPLVIAPEHLASWRVAIIVFAILAIGGLAIQLWLQSREDGKARLQAELDRQQRQESDRRFEEFADLIKGTLAVSSARRTESPLKERALQLARDLFAFLREKGPDPKVDYSGVNSLEDAIRKALETHGPYIEAIHYGYLAHFRQRTIDLFHELAEHGIQVPEVKSWEIDPPQVARESYIRKIAESLFLVAARMDIRDASRST
jgi:hypothetical protein